MWAAVTSLRLGSEHRGVSAAWLTRDVPNLQPGRTRLLLAADRRARDRQRSLGVELKRLREDSALSLTAVARAAGVSAAQLSRIENGNTEASRRALFRVAAVLGADLSERLFPTTGPTIRDRHQAQILEALLTVLHPRCDVGSRSRSTNRSEESSISSWKPHPC